MKHSKKAGGSVVQRRERYGRLNLQVANLNNPEHAYNGVLESFHT